MPAQNSCLFRHQAPHLIPTFGGLWYPVPRNAVQRTQMSVLGLPPSGMTGHHFSLHPPHLAHVVALSRGQDKALVTPAQVRRVGLGRWPERGAGRRKPALSNGSVAHVCHTSGPQGVPGKEDTVQGPEDSPPSLGLPGILPPRDQVRGPGKGKKLQESPANFTSCPAPPLRPRRAGRPRPPGQFGSRSAEESGSGG